LKSNRLRKAGVRADLPLELLAERRRGHGGEQSGANNRPAAELLFEQRDPTMPKQSLQRSGEKLAESAEAAVWRHLEPGVPPPRVDVSRIPPWVLIA